MDNINFNQTGGFPLSTNILEAMQTAYTVFNALGELAGNKAIISGCELAGNTVADGVIYLNGEILAFKGGTAGTNVIIKEDVENRIFENGETKPVIHKRYATFGTSTENFEWQNFKRIETLIELSNKINQLRPIHKEIKWVGRDVQNDDLPNGWFIANGENGTDNLLGRMIIGYNPDDADFDTIGDVGGNKTHKLNSNELPKIEIEVTYANDDETSLWDQGDNTIVGSSSDDIESDNWDSRTFYKYYENRPFSILPPHIIQVPIQYIEY